MGRLIDADKFLERVKKDREHEIYLHSWTADMVLERLDSWYAPAVEAIPKADYENQLKADMVAMLTEIQLELDEMKITKVRSAGFAPYSKDPFRRGVNCSKEIIQQKINTLKEQNRDQFTQAVSDSLVAFSKQIIENHEKEQTE